MITLAMQFEPADVGDGESRKNDFKSRLWNPPLQIYNPPMIGLLQSYHAFEILLAVAGALILIDYFFPTDWPAHLGYFCAGAAAFFRVFVPDKIGEEEFLAQPGLIWNLTNSLLLGVGVWILLEILHRLFFRHFLTNAPGSEIENEVANPEPVAE